MTDIITTDTATQVAANTDKAEFAHLDPKHIKIVSNVRTDRQIDKEFRRSIRERGVLEAVTVYRAEDGEYVCLFGERRTVTAAEEGTPTGLIPARIVPKPDEPDRISDQMVENIHRTDMHESEIVAGVEQLALIGVSAAQITKRMSIPRPTVNAALAVAKADQTRNRLDAGELTLEDAAIFAEFEHDPEAVERLEQCRNWGHSLEHEAQRLRDEAAERAAYDMEVERLRGEGLPVLSGEDAEQARDGLSVERLRTTDDEPIPAEDWPSVPGAAVVVTEEWRYPEDDSASDPESEEDDGNDEDEWAEPVKVYVPVWVVTDPAAVEEAGYVVPRYGINSGHSGQPGEETDEQAEARRAERRKVIANNKAWTSAETVRREWLTGFLTRKTAPKGAESLICEAVVTGRHSLYKAMEANHPRLRDLLGVGADKSRWNSYEEVATIAARATTPKAAVMTTLAAVVAAWEDSTSKGTWRNPSAWDARVLSALIEWGYEPSEVEKILLGKTPASEGEDDTEAVSAEAAA